MSFNSVFSVTSSVNDNSNAVNRDSRDLTYDSKIYLVLGVVIDVRLEVDSLALAVVMEGLDELGLLFKLAFDDAVVSLLLMTRFLREQSSRTSAITVCT